MKNKKIYIFIALALLTLLLIRLFDMNSLFTGRLMPWLHTIVGENYLLAIILYLLFTGAACVFLALPGVTFAFFAGVLFGPFIGSLLCLLGTTLGAVLSFLAGRYFLKSSLKPAIEKNKILNNLLFTEKPENEILLLMITRLLPIFPFNLQNFAYGVTDMGIVKYTLGTFFFMIPGVLAFTFAAAGLIDQNLRTKLFLIAGVIAALTVLLTIFVKQYYEKRYKNQGA